MKHNTTDKSNLRSAKTKVALTLTSIFLACVVCLGVFCVTDGGFPFDNAKEPLTATLLIVLLSAIISAKRSTPKRLTETRKRSPLKGLLHNLSVQKRRRLTNMQVFLSVALWVHCVM